MKKFVFLALVILMGLGFLVYWQFWGERYVLVLSEEQIIEKLSQKFPFEKNYFFFINIKFKNPKLSLEEGSDKIRFGCEVETNMKVDSKAEAIPGPLAGSAILSGQLRYAPSEGAFFLDSPKVENLDISGLPKKYAEKVNSAAIQLAEEFLSRSPIYRLKPFDVKQAAARLILKKVLVSDKKLLITLGIG